MAGRKSGILVGRQRQEGVQAGALTHRRAHPLFGHMRKARPRPVHEPEYVRGEDSQTKTHTPARTMPVAF